MGSLRSIYSKAIGFIKKILFNPLGYYDVKKNLDIAAAEVKSVLTSPAVKITASITTGTVIFGGLNAGFTSASVVTGAAILGAVEDQLIVSAQIGAAGGGLLGGGIALITGAVMANKYRACFFDTPAKTEANVEANSEENTQSDDTQRSCTLDLGAVVGFAILGDLIGYGFLLNIASNSMPLADTIGYAALGSTILASAMCCCSIGALACLSACCLPMYLLELPEEKVNGFTVVRN